MQVMLLRVVTCWRMVHRLIPVNWLLVKTCVSSVPWNGYNFEDSILISESRQGRALHDSPHSEFSCVARDTSWVLEITADIPNVGENALAKLDEVGIVHIGAGEAW